MPQTSIPRRTRRRPRPASALPNPGKSPHVRHIAITEDFLADVAKRKTVESLELLLVQLQNLVKHSAGVGSMYRADMYREQALHVEFVAIPAAGGTTKVAA